ncbi:MAG TPA: PadR family transcriptional regulator [Ktedonobacteraceae bacterium]
MPGDNIAPSQDNENTARSIQDEHDAVTTRKSTMYELFVLGELMDGPHHGYSLRDILSRMLGPFRQISWGVLYPLIRQLEREGLIVQDEESSAAGGTSNSKQRKSYRITESGRKRFSLLMEDQSEYGPDYPEYFIIKLNNFDHISREQQLAILWQYQGYLQALDFYGQSAQQYVSSNPAIPDGQRPHILRTISYRMCTIQAEIAWIEQEIARLEDEPENGQ